jgi:hypothetical protein
MKRLSFPPSFACHGRALWAVALLVIGYAAPPPAHANRPTVATAIPISVSASPRQRFDVDPIWEEIEEDDGAIDQLRATLPQVEYRLDVSQLMGKSIALYLGLPATAALSSSQVQMRWVGRVLKPGTVRVGDRVLVYTGKIDSPTVIDVLALTFTLDSRGMNGPLAITPTFTAEVLP